MVNKIIHHADEALSKELPESHTQFSMPSWITNSILFDSWCSSLSFLFFDTLLFHCYLSAS